MKKIIRQIFILVLFSGAILTGLYIAALIINIFKPQ